MRAWLVMRQQVVETLLGAEFVAVLQAEYDQQHPVDREDQEHDHLLLGLVPDEQSADEVVRGEAHVDDNEQQHHHARPEHD